MVGVVEGFFDWVFLLFTGENAHYVAYFLVSLFFVAFAIIAALAVAAYLTRSTALRKLESFIRVRSESRLEFSKHYEEIDGYFRDGKNRHKLDHGWREFSESLVREDPQTKQKLPEIRNSRRPYDFFHVQDLGRWSPHSFSSISGYFVGIGLLLTFMGLAAALWASADSVAAENVDEAKEGLKQILGVASIKFLTSIAGLGCSILLSMLVRGLSSMLEAKIHSICEQLEFGMHYLTVEEMAMKQLAAMYEQNDQLKQFNGDFAMRLGEEIETRMNIVMKTAMTQAMQPITDEIKNHLSTAADGGAKALEESIQNLNKNISENAKDEISATVTALSGVKESLGDLVEKISLSGGGLNDAVDQSAKAFQSAMQDSVAELSQSMKTVMQSMTDDLHKGTGNITSGMESSLASLKTVISDAGNGFTENLGEVAQAMQLGVNSLSDNIQIFNQSVSVFDDKIRQNLNAFDSSAKQMREGMQAFDGTADKIQNALQPFDRAATSFGQATNLMQQTVEQIQTNISQLSQATQQITESCETTKASWQEYQSRFENVDESLAKVLQEFNQQLETTTGKVQEFTKEVDSQFASGLTQLKSTIEEFGEVIEEFDNARAA